MIKEKIKSLFSERTFIILFILYVINKNFTFSVLTYNSGFSLARKIILYSIYGIFFCKILIDIYKSKKINYLCLGLFLLSCIASLISKNKELLGYVLVIIAIYKLDFNKIVRSCLFGNLFSFSVITILSLLGFIPNLRVFTPDGIAYSLGYYYSTFPATYVFLMFLMRFYLKKENVKSIEILSSLVINFVVYKITLSETAFILNLGILFFEIVYKIYKYKKWNIKQIAYKNILSIFFIIIPILIFGFSFITTFTYNPQIEIYATLDKKLNNRVHLAKEAVDKYGVSAFGKKIKWIGNGGKGYMKDSGESYNFVDNAYIRIMLDYGLIFLCVILLVYLLGQIEFSKQKKYIILFINTLILIWGITEPNLLEIEKNVFIVITINSVINKEKYYLEIKRKTI